MAFRMLPIALAAIWLAALTSSASTSAQIGSGLAVEIASIDNSALPALSAVVNVLDAKGRPVAGLDAAAFSAAVDGKPATISGVQTVVDSQVSLSVILAVDVSGSMAGQPLTASQAAAAEFVNGLSPQDSVAVLAFNDTVSVAQEATTDRAAATAALQQLNAVGNTALFEATSRAVTKAAESPSARRVIILLSDGVDYGGKSTVTRDDSIAQARFAGIPIYTIALGAEVDKGYLSELAQATGARFLETPSPEWLSQLYADIGSVLRGQYIVSLQSPDVDQASAHTLELSVSMGGATAVGSKSIAAGASPGQTPEVTLKGIDDGQKLKSAATITAGLSNGAPAEVRFLVDGQQVATVVTPPFQATLDPATLSNGDHTLRIEVKNAVGETLSSETHFAIAPLTTSSMNKALLFAGLLGMVTIVMGFYFLRRRNPRAGRDAVEVRLRPWSSASLAGGISLISDESPSPEPETAEASRGKLVVVGGQSSAQEFAVGAQPISIGSAPWCDIIVSGSDVGSEEARAWVHQDKLIFHRLMRLSLFANDQDTGGWLILENGDEITVGDVRLRFSSQAHMTKEEAVLNRAVNEAVQHFVARQSSGMSSQGFAARLWPADEKQVAPDVDSPADPLQLQPADHPPMEELADGEDAASEPSPALWLVEEEQVESEPYLEDDPFQAPPTEESLSGGSCDQEDAASQAVHALWPVDELPIESDSAQDDIEPPTAASSA